MKGNSLSKTPSPIKDRIFGSKTNKKGSAASKYSAKGIQFSNSVITTLENKKDEYNAKHPNNKVTLATLKAVFRRGAGAYSTSHRPNITRSGWAYARVNKFLLKKGGTKVKAAYVQDDDLMERGAILNSSCKTYIFQNKSVLKTGYYLNLSDFSSMIDPYGQIPLNLTHTLVTYNSGNQDGLSLINTINPINLQNELADILNIPINKAQVVVGLYIEMAKKLKSISEIEGDNIIVIDRDNVVCKSEKNDALMEQGGLLAPNLKPSNLTPEQYKLVRTPEFKAWFGDWENDPEYASKVVDENGEPLVVYHGTKKKFNIFKINDAIPYSFFAENYKYANEYANSEDFVGKPKLYKCFLNIRTPFDSSGVKFWRESPIVDTYIIEQIGKDIKKGIIAKKDIDYKIIKTLKDFIEPQLKYGTTILWHIFRNDGMGYSDFLKTYNKDFSNNNKNKKRSWLKFFLEGFGYNGFIQYENIYGEEVKNYERESKKNPYYASKVYAIFNSNQVKLADGSNTTFDSNNPDIRYEQGGLLAPNGRKSNLSPENYKLVRTLGFKKWYGDWENDPTFPKNELDENREPIIVLQQNKNKYSKGGLLAPNDKPSNLTPEQYKLVRTYAFKAWFGDWEKDPENSSKVVDENGEPKVYYSGHRYIDYPEGKNLYEKNNSGIFFTANLMIAQTYGMVKSVFINSRNPKDIRNYYGYDNKKISSASRNDPDKRLTYDEMKKYSYTFKTKEEQEYLNSDPNVIKFYEEVIDKYAKRLKNDKYSGTPQEIKEVLIQTSEKGYKFLNFRDKSGVWNLIAKYIKNSEYDGVLATDEDKHADDIADSVVVYNSNQVKLADGSNTTFDVNNPDIRYEQGGNIESDAFKKWFGNSKVVDKKGNPLVVYHGSPDLRGLKSEYIFKPRFDSNKSFFFTDNYKMAKSYADPTRAWDYQNAEEGVIGLYLSIQNPLIVNAENQIWRKFETEINGEKIVGTRDLIEYAKNKHDGVIVKNVRDYYDKNDKMSSGGNVYVVFQPTQIKIADGSNTLYDINNPDIRYERGGYIKKAYSPFKKVQKSITQELIPILEWVKMERTQEDGSKIISNSSEFYLWIYNDIDANKKLKEGIYEYAYPTIDFGNNLESIWNNFKQYKGNKRIVGFVVGSVRESGVTTRLDNGFNSWQWDGGYYRMEIGIMTTKPIYRRKGVNEFAIKYLRNRFNLKKEQVDFYKPTEQGSLFISSKKYEGGGLIAPNGQQSNLTPEQYKLVRTPEFKAWFGDWENDPESASKVVDINGEPLVCYHGTKKKFYKFKNKKNVLDKNPNYVSGFWFFADPIGDSLSEEDREYFYDEGNALYMAQNWITNDDGYGIAKVLECFLNVRNPIQTDSYAEFQHYLKDDYVIKAIENKEKDGWFIHGSRTDGNIYRDDINVFNSNQIKLADGSNTTFDSSNPDIRYNKGGIIKNIAKGEIKKIGRENYIIKTNYKNQIKHRDELIELLKSYGIKIYSSESAPSTRSYYIEAASENYDISVRLSNHTKPTIFEDGEYEVINSEISNNNNINYIQINILSTKDFVLAKKWLINNIN